VKIVYVGRYNGSETQTGPEKVAARIFHEASKEFDTKFITYFFDGKDFGLFTKLFGKEKLQASANGIVLRCGIITMLFELTASKPDIIHIINYERFASAIGYIRRLLHGKIIYTVHGIAAYENEQFKQVPKEYAGKDGMSESRILKLADTLVFLSDRSIDIAEKFYEIDKSRCVVLPNGIDSEFASSGVKSFAGKTLNLVFVGRTDRAEKGFEQMKEVMNNLNFDAQLFVVNSGRVGKEGNISYLGAMNMKDLSSFYDDKHIFISPSIYEPFSLSAAEAMASGLVVIASKETGMSRYIENAVNGFVLDACSAVNITDLLNNLNNDRSAMSAISENAKKLYNELSWEKVFDKYKEVYQ
jgi:glycosyltransferase involved in cell wall biosynthesis